MERSRTLKRWARSRSVTEHAVMEETMRGTDVTRQSANRTLDASRLEPGREARLRSSKGRRFCMLAIATLLATACVPHVNEERVQVPSGSGTRVPERRAATLTRGDVQSGVEPTISASLDGNVVRVKVEQPMECREVVRTPMAERTKRTLSNGPLAQTVNVVAGAGLLALGVAGFASIGSSCSKTPDPTEQNPTPASRPCTADEQKKQDTSNAAIGGVSTGLALVPIGLFIWNIVRAKDGEITPVAPKEEGSEWTQCGTSPASGIPIELQTGRSSLTQTTDAQGSATFDLAAVQNGDDVADDGQVIVRVGEKSSQSVDVRSTPIFSTWASSLRSKNATQERRAEQSQAIFAAARKRQADIVAAIATWAGSNLVASQGATVVRTFRRCFNAYKKPMDCNYPGGVASSVDWYVTRISTSLQNRSSITVQCHAVDDGFEKKKFFVGEFKPGSKKSGAIEQEDLAPLRARATFACSVTAADLKRGVVQDDVADAFRLEKFDGVILDVTNAKDVLVGIGERWYRWNGNDYEMVQ